MHTLVIIGDRLRFSSRPVRFFLMGKVGGNHLAIGVGSTIAGQIAVGAIGGAFWDYLRRNPARASHFGPAILPCCRSCVCNRALVVLGIGYIGLPIGAARLSRWSVSRCAFLRSSVKLWLVFDFLHKEESQTRLRIQSSDRAACFTGRDRAAVTGGGIALARSHRARRLAATARSIKAASQPITPNELFYCVTKNGRSASGRRSLAPEVDGLVKNAATGIYDLLGFETSSRNDADVH
jgi:hypothetical protein